MNIKMNKREISDFKHNYKKLYELPYKAKNGIRFSNNGVSMVTSYGIVFSDNCYFGKDSYGPMLRHVESAGDGSTSYDVSVRVSGKSNSDLDILAAAIEDNMKRNALRVLKRFERRGLKW